MKTLTQKLICTPVVITALFTIAKTWKQPKCPSRGKDVFVCIYSVVIKKEILPSAKLTDFEGIMLSEISRMEKDKYRMISLTHGI